jgi:hypothetical protein
MSMVRTDGVQPLKFIDELAEPSEQLVDAEVSSRSSNFDLMGFMHVWAFELALGYGIQIADVRVRDAQAPMGMVAPVNGEPGVGDRASLALAVPAWRGSDADLRLYTMAAISLTPRLRDLGGLPMHTLEAGVEVAIAEPRGPGLSVRVGLTMEGGYAEREEARASYEARGLVVTLLLRHSDAASLFGGIWVPEVARGRSRHARVAEVVQ